MTDVLQRSVEGLAPGRAGRWRLVLRQRDFDTINGARPIGRDLGELTEARSRRLSRELNKPTGLTFSFPGDSDAASVLRELQHEVLAYRVPESGGAERLMFRGIVYHTQDVISEQAHTVNVTCYDYLAPLSRRWVAPGTISPWSWIFNNIDQDTIISQLVNYAQGISVGIAGATGYEAWAATSRLGVSVARVNPDGTARAALSGRIRYRDYPLGTNIGEAIDNMAEVIDGFDYDVRPVADSYDRLNVYYPYQGIDRNAAGAFRLIYGDTVSSLSRSLNCNYFANMQNVIGQPANPADQPPVYRATAANLNFVAIHPEGVWNSWESRADVKIYATLGEIAAGNLARSYPLTPSYSLNLRPTAYRVDSSGPVFDIGDRVALTIRRGRLNVVDTWVRILGIEHVIGDDGQEDVDVTVGQVLPTTFPGLFQGTDSRLLALERR